MAKSFNSIMKELDKHRGYPKKEIVLTKQQREFLLKCRDHYCPVSYPTMAKLWQYELGWGKANEDKMRRYYLKLKNGLKTKNKTK